VHGAGLDVFNYNPWEITNHVVSIVGLLIVVAVALEADMPQDGALTLCRPCPTGVSRTRGARHGLSCSCPSPRSLTLV
jgi:hypothetical protein